MQLRTAALATAAVVAAAGAGVDVAAGAATAPAAAATIRLVVRPVTAAGHARPGVQVANEPGDQVDCSFQDPSPGAVNPDIELCSPSAAYAIACWNAASRGHVLCTRDPSRKKLVRLPRVHRFARTPMAKPGQRAPLLLVLTDGTRCSIRDGGAWGQLASHPTWYGTYGCDKHGVVWSPPNASHDGVDETHASWTVRTSPASGDGRVVVRHVRTAYFVGTQQG